jgi:hypothetical protein
LLAIAFVQTLKTSSTLKQGKAAMLNLLKFGKIEHEELVNEVDLRLRPIKKKEGHAETRLH